MQFSIFLYFALLGFIISLNESLYIILWIIFGILILSLVPVVLKIKIEKVKQGIKNNSIKININKACWQEIEQLPDFTPVKAKKAVWIRKHNGFYSSLEEFFEKNDVKNKETIEKFISY